MMNKEEKGKLFTELANDFNETALETAVAKHVIHTTTVRYAVPEDYPQIIALGEELHAENGHSEIDYPRAEATIMEGINRKASFIGIIGDVGKIEGIVFIRFASFWNSSDIFAEELFLYVPPAFRKTGNAKTLLRFAMDTTEKLGLPLMIGVQSNHRTKAKLKLYEKQLGTPVGGYFFVHDPKNKLRLA